MDKKLLVAAAAGASLVMVLAGCSQAEPKAAAADAPVTLDWSMWGNSQAETDGWQAVADMVHQADPNITLKLSTAPWGDYWTKMPTQIAGGAGPCIAGVQSSHTASFSKFLQPLDEQIKANSVDLSEFDEGIIGALKNDGKQMALPYDFGPTIIYYNKDAFAGANLPMPANGWTTDQFLSAAKSLSSGDKFGFAADIAIDAMAAWAPSVGGTQLATKDGKLDASSAGIAKTLTWYSGLVKDKVSSPMVSGGTATPVSKFLAGNAAMMVGGPWDMVNIKGTAKFDVGVVTIPAGDGGAVTTTGGSGFGVTASCKNPEAAAKAISLITGPDVEGYLAESGRAFPARTAEQDKWYTNAVAGSKETLEAAAPSGMPGYATSNWDEVNAAWLQGVVTVMNGDAPVQPFLDGIQKQFGN